MFFLICGFSSRSDLLNFFLIRKLSLSAISCLQRVFLTSACLQQGQLAKLAAFSRLKI